MVIWSNLSWLIFDQHSRLWPRCILVTCFQWRTRRVISWMAVEYLAWSKKGKWSEISYMWAQIRLCHKMRQFPIKTILGRFRPWAVPHPWKGHLKWLSRMRDRLKTKSAKYGLDSINSTLSMRNCLILWQKSYLDSHKSLGEGRFYGHEGVMILVTDDIFMKMSFPYVYVCV